jgi:hypothetical protein
MPDWCPYWGKSHRYVELWLYRGKRVLGCACGKRISE